MRNIFLLIFITLVLSEKAFAQKPAKIKRIWEEAESLFDFGDYRSALTEYQKIIKSKNNKNIYYKKSIFKTGVCFYNLSKYDSALSYFSNLNDSIFRDVLFYKGEISHKQNHLSASEKTFRAYLSNSFLSNDSLKTLAEHFLNQVKFAQHQQSSPSDITITNLGAPINTIYDEYVPLISADNKTLYFTARWPNSTGGKTDAFGKYFEDIYKCSNINGNWTTPKKLDTVINSEWNDACAGLSPDEQKLFIFKTAEDLISGDLYLSQMGTENWEKPKKLQASINSDYTESSASITTDDRIIYFSSDRPGGYGGKDIYKVTLLPNGTWSKAVNLGPMINTAYDEDAPFIHPTGKLYFSSKGHAKNMGGYDVFVVEKDDEGNWLQPQNLGYPLNSVNDDIFFVLAANGKTGYYSSDKLGGMGGQDLYKIDFPENKETLIVKHGKLTFNASPLKAKITLINEDSHLIEGEYFSNSNSGKFIFLIKPNTNYKLLIEVEGHSPFIIKLNESDLLLQDVFTLNLPK